MHRLRVPLMLLALALGAASAAEAQNIPSPYEYIERGHSVELFGGYLLAGEGEPDLGPHPAPFLGARYVMRLTGPLQGEARLAFAPSQRTVIEAPNPDEPGTVEEIGDVDAYLVQLQAGFRLQIPGPRTWNDLSPYVSATAGLVSDLAGESELDDGIPVDQRFDFGPGFAVGVGIGTDWFVSERHSIRLELRDDLWRLQIPDGLLTDPDEETQWTHNPSLSLGVALHF